MDVFYYKHHRLCAGDVKLVLFDCRSGFFYRGFFFWLMGTLFRFLRFFNLGLFGCAFGAFTIAIDDDLDLWNEIHRQADVGSKFAERADGLNIHLLALHFKADLFGKRGGDILCGNGTVQFSGITSLGWEAKSYFLDLVGDAFEVIVLCTAADLSLRLDLLDLLQCAFGGKHGKSLRDEEVTAEAIGYFLNIPGTSKFVNVFNKQYFHFL